jgi:hypothetical protein
MLIRIVVLTFKEGDIREGSDARKSISAEAREDIFGYESTSDYSET